MSVGEMDMSVLDGPMPMRVDVPGVSRHEIIVTVLVVLVMNVLVFVFQGLVDMVMGMMFGKMEPHTNRHQGSGQQ